MLIRKLVLLFYKLYFFFSPSLLHRDSAIRDMKKGYVPLSMPVRIPHIHDSGLYFITFTNYKWLPLIEITNGYQLIYNWFDHLVKNGHEIAGYVIMPNHIHALIGFNKPKQSLNSIIGNGKRFIAYGIVQLLKDSGRDDVLVELTKAVQPGDGRRGKKHEVFEPSFDIKECRTLAFISQKLGYIHNNPLSGKWSLAADTISYPHSSAMFYETGEQGLYSVTNAANIFDKDWA